MRLDPVSSEGVAVAVSASPELCAEDNVSHTVDPLPDPTSAGRVERPPPSDTVQVDACDGPRSGAGAVLTRSRHEDTCMWGPFGLTWSAPNKRPPHGSWQATCPFHKLSKATGCKKAIGLKNKTDEEKQECCSLLKMWCLAVVNHDRRTSHCRVQPRQIEMLDDSVLEARLALLPALPGPDALLDHETLDQRAAAEAKAKARPKAMAKAKGKASSRAKAAAKTRPKAVARAAAKAAAAARDAIASPGDEVASDSSSDDLSLGSRSSSSSSSSGGSSSSVP